MVLLYFLITCSYLFQGPTVHIKWFARGTDTVLGNTGDPTELFMLGKVAYCLISVSIGSIFLRVIYQGTVTLTTSVLVRQCVVVIKQVSYEEI